MPCGVAIGHFLALHIRARTFMVDIEKASSHPGKCGSENNVPEGLTASSTVKTIVTRSCTVGRSYENPQKPPRYFKSNREFLDYCTRPRIAAKSVPGFKGGRGSARKACRLCPRLCCITRRYPEAELPFELWWARVASAARCCLRCSACRCQRRRGTAEKLSEPSQVLRGRRQQHFIPDAIQAS
jgi:hypothetical protein